MIWLPDQELLVHHICEALQEVAASFPVDAISGRTDAIGVAIRSRLDDHEHGIECAFGYRNADGRTKREDEREWLFDLSAVLVDPPDPQRLKKRYTMQALVVGEIEWHNNLEKTLKSSL
jgi:hypothetical protein